MSFRSFRAVFALTGLLATIGLGSYAIGQSGSNRDEAAVRLPSGDIIPKAALLTERGRQLVDELRHLRRAEAGMGARHPSLNEVRASIADVKEQIAAWSPLSEDPSGLPSRPLADNLPAMNERDLRQLILRMSAKIEILERRVDALERKQNVF